METSVLALLFCGCFVAICIIKWTWTGLLQESHSFWLCKTSFSFWHLKFNWKSSPLSCSPTQNLTACLKQGPEAQCKFSFSFFTPLFLLQKDCFKAVFPLLSNKLESPWTQVSHHLRTPLIHSALSSLTASCDCTESKHVLLLTLQPLPLLVLLAQPARIEARSSFYLPVWYCNLIYWHGWWQHRTEVWLPKSSCKIRAQMSKFRTQQECFGTVIINKDCRKCIRNFERTCTKMELW